MIVEEVELPARVDDFVFAAIVELRAQNFAHGVAHFDHSANPARGFVGQVRDRRERRARADRDRAVVRS